MDREVETGWTAIISPAPEIRDQRGGLQYGAAEPGGGTWLPIIRRLAPGKHRRHVVCDPESDTIHIVDIVSRKVIGDVSGLGAPRGVIIAPDNRTAFVTVADDPAVVAVDLVERREVMRVSVGASPDGVGYSPLAPGARQLE